MAQGNTPMQSSEAQELLKDTARLRALMSSPEMRQLAQMLNAKSGGGLQNAASAAKAGDTAQLEALLKGLSSTPEGAKLLAQLQGKLGK